VPARRSGRSAPTPDRKDDQVTILETFSPSVDPISEDYDESTEWELANEYEAEDQLAELAEKNEQCDCEDCTGCTGRVGTLDETYEVTPVPSGSRPPIRSTAALRNAWREYRCATNRMVQLRLFGKWNTPVNPKTVDAWRALESTLAAAGYDVHRAWVYVCRNIAGQKSASLHAYGLAIDIDHAGPRCNVNNPTPDRRNVRFSSAATKLERCRDVQRGVADTAFTPEQVAGVEAIRTVDGYQVFAWGGRWPTTKDTMHFQINVTPQELSRGIAPETIGTVASADESDAGLAFELDQLAVAEGGDEETWFEDEEESDGWTGSPDQIAFRDRVLAAHLAQSKRLKGQPFRDRRRDELHPIPGTEVYTLPQTADAAGRLIAAANADLAAARAQGDPDARRTKRITATSGYRSSTYQRKRWHDLFPKYYNQSRSARTSLPGGPHSDAAVAYMLRRKDDGGFGVPGRIAAPGYSNHENGIAVDLYQIRTPGLPNSTADRDRAKWRATWFYKWLTEKGNGRRFGFKQLPTEEWHWEYQGQTAGQRQEKPASAESTANGQQWTYRSRVAGTQVAVYIPPTAFDRDRIDLLLYIHGLLGPCGKLPSVPGGFIGSRQFALGPAVRDSGLPMALLVPLMQEGNDRSWSAQGLDKPARLNAFLAEALNVIGQHLNRVSTLSRLVVAGHSRAFGVLYPLAGSHADARQHADGLAKLSAVWLLDGSYGRVPMEAFKALTSAHPGLAVRIIYRTGSPTDKFRGRKLAGPVEVRPIDRSIQHCDVPRHVLGNLLADLSPGLTAAEDEIAQWLSEQDSATEWTDEVGEVDIDRWREGLDWSEYEVDNEEDTWSEQDLEAGDGERLAESTC
jgi:D-alanyl-D-alanine carboxypeptidase